MKAFLLAAGLGTRLKPLTDSIPKCLVPVRGEPLLGIWLKLLRKHDVNDILINTHYLPHMVKHFLDTHGQGLNVRIFHEPELLGTGGTIAANVDFVRDVEHFFVLYADNLTNIRLDKMLRFHLSHGDILTMGVFRTNKPEQCGIAQLDENGHIVSFVEKPERPVSDLANAGVLVARREFINHLPHERPMDLSRDVLPRLAGKMRGYLIREYLIDIGTMENYNAAQQNWPGL